MADLTYNDILSESLDITQTPFTEDTENSVVQVTTTISGVPQMRRMRISTLTADVDDAIEQAQEAASDASAKAAEAYTASQSATSAANLATQKAEALDTAISDLQSQIDAYYSQADQNVKSRLRELAEMASTGQLDVTVDSVQLFEDFCRVNQFTGTYDDFLVAIAQGGGGSWTVDSEMSSTSTNPVQNKVIKGAVDGKQDLLSYVSYTELLEIVNLVD